MRLTLPQRGGIEDLMDISIRGLKKTFGNSPAIHGIDLDVRSGELLGLLGPSGSGKTTLLRMIAGLEIPTAGQIYFGEEDASRKSVQDRRVGFVFQSYALFKHMSVSENIAYGLNVRPRAQRPSAAMIAKRVADLLELMQLGGFGARFPAQLSGGQRQRVALARALAVEPRVLLLDEPFGALDAQVRKDLRRWLREIHLRTGHTTLFVTHDQDEALELSDRVAVLARGRLEQVASPDDIYDHPASAFVHGFIGESNQIYGEIIAQRFISGGIDLGLPASTDLQGPCLLFVRPQHVEIKPAAQQGLRGTVESVRRSAGGHRLQIALPQIKTSLEAIVGEDVIAPQGHQVSVAFARSRLFKLSQ
jgi:sulfate transport system ATP-binding protein